MSSADVQGTSPDPWAGKSAPDAPEKTENAPAAVGAVGAAPVGEKPWGKFEAGKSNTLQDAPKEKSGWKNAAGNATGPNLPRKRISHQQYVGQVVEWKGNYGWIQPAEPIRHPKAGLRQGRVFISRTDLGNSRELMPGMMVQFQVFEDEQGLGAENCMLFDPSMGWKGGGGWGKGYGGKGPMKGGKGEKGSFGFDKGGGRPLGAMSGSKGPGGKDSGFSKGGKGVKGDSKGPKGDGKGIGAGGPDQKGKGFGKGPRGPGFAPGPVAQGSGAATGGCSGGFGEKGGAGANKMPQGVQGLPSRPGFGGADLGGMPGGNKGDKGKGKGKDKGGKDKGKGARPEFGSQRPDSMPGYERLNMADRGQGGMGGMDCGKDGKGGKPGGSGKGGGFGKPAGDSGCGFRPGATNGLFGFGWNDKSKTMLQFMLFYLAKRKQHQFLLNYTCSCTPRLYSCCTRVLTFKAFVKYLAMPPSETDWPQQSRREGWYSEFGVAPAQHATRQPDRKESKMPETWHEMEDLSRQHLLRNYAKLHELQVPRGLLHMQPAIRRNTSCSTGSDCMFYRYVGIRPRGITAWPSEFAGPSGLAGPAEPPGIAGAAESSEPRS
ncbi:unnamed protein product [Polarella glacialis]|uniref:Uncharacterized protein n=1 Tax=Polarella glacialis TaxID=89957 RepID=A0A813LMH1_POLGL|nr:unnamed protein product [Polarella glacialis]